MQVPSARRIGTFLWQAVQASLRVELFVRVAADLAPFGLAVQFPFALLVRLDHPVACVLPKHFGFKLPFTLRRLPVEATSR